MRRTSIGRLLGALCLAGSFVLTTSGTASASPPHWSMSVVDLPSLVSNGSGAGYRVTISNSGPSNISTLFLVTKVQDSPSFITTTQGTCSAPGAGPLSCSFGALNAGKSVTVVVGYVTPASGAAFDPVFQGNSNGATFSDPGRSHGDTLQDPNETPTQLTTNRDFAGGFALNRNKVTTDTNLSKTNVQSTSVTPPVVGVIATVQDGLGGPDTCTGCTKTLFGDWAQVTVGHGETFGDLFPVTLLVFGKSLPKQATTDTIDMVHVLDNGTTEILSTRCGPTPTLNCVTVTPVGSNYRITGWVNQNGRVKGMG
jgi:hypothetical protein